MIRTPLIALVLYTSQTIAQPNFLNQEPSWSPDGESIVFVSKRDGNNEIYTMSKDGSNQRRLTNTPQNESQPSWSPDGNKILFLSERTGVSQIYSMNIDGTSQINLTKSRVPEYQATWSPSGDKIAFVSVRDENSQVYIMNIDGGNPQRIIKTQTNVSFPIWSPDGKQIACMSLDIWKNKIDFFKYDVVDNSYKSIFGEEQPYRFFDWAKKSNHILFTKNKFYSSGESISEIYISEIELVNQEKVSKNITQLITASLSPNDDKVLYTTRQQVLVLTLGNMKPIKIGKKHHSAEWSPDGKSIIMVSSGKMNIYSVNADGTDLKQLTFGK